MPEVNQQLIADRLGLSRATVSRCFTNHAGINPLTRAKVFQVAAEVGYTHMASRSSQARKATPNRRFCVLICSDPDEYFRGAYRSPGEQILSGVSEYVQLHDIKMDVHLVPPQASSIADTAYQEIESLSDRDRRGLLLIYPFPEPVIEQLAIQFPLVSLVDQLEHGAIDCVDVDHYNGISLAIEHLCRQGHRRIGFYTKTYTVEASWSLRRYAAFMEKMARMRLELRPDDVIGVFPRENRAPGDGLLELVEKTRQGVTAWVCAADHQGYDVIDALRRDGIRVPEDVSVTGFDGITAGEGKPDLTTIRIPYREIGMIGAERLAARMKQRFQGKQHIYISGQLHEGQTVGAHSSGA